MGKNIRNVFISFACALGLTTLYRAHVRRKGPLVRVLVFHDVSDGEWFEECLLLLSEQYHVLTPEQFFKREFDANRTNILITFDDGYASWKEICLPILERYGMKALFFVNSGLLDLHGKEEQTRGYMEHKLLIRPREILSWEEVRVLREAGHTIGGHTLNHIRLSKHPIEVQRHEIVSDKEHTEREIGGPMSSFAYPFGSRSDYTEETKQVLQRAGYVCAFTTEGMFIDLDQPYAYARMGVEDGIDKKTLREWIDGGYDLYRMVK